MSKMACLCGGVISDCRCPCPTEGSIVGAENNEELQSQFVADVGAFLTAVREGRRIAWLSDYFLSGYPTDQEDAEIISDILTRCSMSRSLSIAECESCGRLWVQEAPGENWYRSFRPDKGGYAALLARKTDVKA